MEFEYTGRHVDVTPALRAHVEDHFQKMDHIFNDTTARAHVIIEVEKNRQIGEVLVHWRDHTLTATDTNADMYLALTRAIAKIEKQALKLKKKIIDRKQGAKRISARAPAAGRPARSQPAPAAHHHRPPLCGQADDGRRSRAAALRRGPTSFWSSAMPTRIASACSTSARTATSA